MILQLKSYFLPHDGKIWGSKAGKQQIIPAGTRIYCICYGTLLFCYGYLNEAQAMTVMEGLQGTVDQNKNTVAFNFFDKIPTSIARPPT